jgi:dTDP-4-amino-4,6-dideoxygalactose transaminase
MNQIKKIPQKKNRYIHEIKGINSRLDEIQAAILNVKLNYLDSFIEKRNEIAKIYEENLSNIKQVKLPKTAKNNYHAFHLYAIEVEKRDELKEFLLENGAQTIIHYPIPVHKQKCFSEYNELILANTELISDKILSLPINPFIENSEIKRVIELIRKFYKYEE